MARTSGFETRDAVGVDVVQTFHVVIWCSMLIIRSRNVRTKKVYFISHGFSCQKALLLSRWPLPWYDWSANRSVTRTLFPAESDSLIGSDTRSCSILLNLALSSEPFSSFLLCKGLQDRRHGLAVSV